MADRALAVREGDDRDVPRVVELLKASLGEGAIPRTREFWQWKHEKNPFGRSPFWLAESDGEIVGVRVFLRWRWHARAHTVEAVRAVDTATHPGHQGKGIFRTLTLHGVEELTRRGVGFVFNTPNDKSRPGYLKMGWSTVGRPSLWIAPRKVTAVARVVAARLGRRQSPSTPDTNANDDSSGRDFLNGAELARLLDRVETLPDKLRTQRDAAYLRWRYVDCPGMRYTFTSSDEGNALAVHRVRHRAGAKEVAICELMAAGERSTAGEIAGLLRRVLAHSNADYGVVAPPHDARGALALALAGFVPAPRAGPVLTVRPMALPAGLPTLFERRSWAPSVGDIELF